MTKITEKPVYVSREEKKGITQEFVKEYFDYKDGFLYYKKKHPCSKMMIGDKLGFIAFYKDGQRKNRCKILGNMYLVSRLIFLYHNGYLPVCVDHIDHNELDNRIENLRAATKSENCRNRRSNKKSSSPYLGVSYHIRIKKFGASIRVCNKAKHLGYFETEEEAALWYNREAVKSHKEFANLNIIKPK